jgi:hypothetical protein
VDAEQYPELADHAVEGPPVVPAALVVEWMARAVASLSPGAPAVRLEDLRVACGLVLERWPDAGLRLTLEAAPAGDGWALRLLDPDGRPRYTARGRAALALPAAPALLEELPPARETPYRGGALFHGPRFRSLAPLEGLGEAGATAWLVGAAALGWTRRPGRGAQRTDTPRLDGALQLGVLVTEHLTGGASLPTRVGALTLRLDGPGEAAGRAGSRTRARSADQITHDIVALDAEGAPWVVVEGFETTRRPGGKPRS